MKILVTGGYGFIGSHLIRYLLTETEHTVLNIDKLAYSADLKRLLDIERSDRYSFRKTDITNYSEVLETVTSFGPDVIMNLAAESHVDNSIISPKKFIETNIFGTFNLLEAFRKHLEDFPEKLNKAKFHQISTDEVYGDLASKQDSFDNKGRFNEISSYLPSSPYSASKASADHLVKAWGRTFNLPAVITTCSNNYGPYQHEEKLIPKVISNAIRGKKIPVYGNGQQIRDWLYVEDHVRALVNVAENGIAGETYSVGGSNEQKNIDVVTAICSILDELHPQEVEYGSLINFIKDRPGHDMHYAIDSSKIQSALGWKPKKRFDEGLRETISWYLAS